MLKGMVQVLGVTYRIVRLRHGLYEVVRLLDDARVGTFHTGPPLSVSAEDVSEELMRDIARSAVKQARTSWARLNLR